MHYTTYRNTGFKKPVVSPLSHRHTATSSDPVVAYRQQVDAYINYDRAPEGWAMVNGELVRVK